MQALTLPATRGWHWLVNGFGSVRKNPLQLSLLVFSYWLIFRLFIEKLGDFSLLLGLLTPIIAVCLMNAVRQSESVKTRTRLFLLADIKENLRPLLQLGMVHLLFNALIWALMYLLSDAPSSPSPTQNGDPASARILHLSSGEMAALCLYIPLAMAFWFAPVLSAWHQVSPSKALFFSFFACVRNWRAFVTYCLSVLLFFIVLASLLLMLGTLQLGQATFASVFAVLFLPTLQASFYQSYREIFLVSDQASA